MIIKKIIESKYNTIHAYICCYYYYYKKVACPDVSGVGPPVRIPQCVSVRAGKPRMRAGSLSFGSAPLQLKW